MNVKGIRPISNNKTIRNFLCFPHELGWCKFPQQYLADKSIQKSVYVQHYIKKTTNLTEPSNLMETTWLINNIQFENTFCPGNFGK